MSTKNPETSHSSASPAILVKHPFIWQGKDLDASNRQTISSGYKALDEALEGGWPESGVVEITCRALGSGELRMILPVLKKQQQNGLQCWVNPPARLQAQSLLNAELKLHQHVVIRSDTPKSSLWAVDQMLSSHCCSVVVMWYDKLDTAQAKRLQVKAKQHQVLLFVVRLDAASDTHAVASSQAKFEQSLPISLRMKIKASPRGVYVDIFKRQYGWPVKPFHLAMNEQWPQLVELALENQTKLSDMSSKHPRESIQSDNVIAFPKRCES